MFSVDISSLQWFETVCRYLELRSHRLGVDSSHKRHCSHSHGGFEAGWAQPCQCLIPSIETQNGVHWRVWNSLYWWECFWSHNSVSIFGCMDLKSRTMTVVYWLHRVSGTSFQDCHKWLIVSSFLLAESCKSQTLPSNLHPRWGRVRGGARAPER